ncbi:hypothetical protein SD77_3384 [Bacillus badius]|uniref:Secreted protein n=1 Tax=Bacillus badius TaxID=1455 RepID=A0ABR5AZ54_BACBA|nr:hypothetical protein SD77_3384 [Bacillus badius]
MLIKKFFLILLSPIFFAKKCLRLPKIIKKELVFVCQLLHNKNGLNGTGAYIFYEEHLLNWVFAPRSYFIV